MYTAIIILIIFTLVLLNLYYPILTTNFNNIMNEIRGNKTHHDELAKTDAIIAEITNPQTSTTKSVNTLTEEFEGGPSIYKKYNLIDDNGCYEPKFSRCSNEAGERGYKIFTPFQNDCLVPGRELTNYDAAFAQLDKYLNNLPYMEGGADEAERRETCINKPSVKAGVGLFGLCNRRELTDRYCSLQDQKAELADLNPGLEEEDLDRGLSNMELIHSVCFPDSTLSCAPVTTTTQPPTTTTT